MQVKIMAQPVIVMQEDATLEAVARTMLDHHFGCVPVGMVSRHDLLRMVVNHQSGAETK